MSRVGHIQRGVGLALVAALLFGITAPLLQRATLAAGAFASGSLLYLGAALAASLSVALRRRDVAVDPAPRLPVARVALVSLLGSALAPALLVAGLKRVDGATASLLLALEAPLTVALARLVLRERVGARVAAAAVLITLGACVLVRGAFGSPVAFGGALLIGAAALAWSLDNLAARALADVDPLRVVAAKGALGAGLAGLAAVFVHDARPAVGDALAIVGLGAVGYGLSLVVYLRAQRVVGAARTASIFATAPFYGAAVALLLGAPWLGWGFLGAAALIGAGVALHLTEHHAHAHRHEAVEHEHLHSHDDGHHDHAHEPMPRGPHSHPHHHEALSHVHEHGEDLHHRHAH